jgi:hypothetical protein
MPHRSEPWRYAKIDTIVILNATTLFPSRYLRCRHSRCLCQKTVGEIYDRSELVIFRVSPAARSPISKSRWM